MASSTGLLVRRASSHSASPHSCAERQTREAELGGFSAYCASGSARSAHWPSAPRRRYLYWAPIPTPSAWTCHTPEPSSLVIGWAEPSQPAHSPATCTSRAFGAQTRNERSEERRVGK